MVPIVRHDRRAALTSLGIVGLIVVRKLIQAV
jgi:hypothetical protein